ncbi:hypothetical protein [Luoshenia tenuis]|uniref:hypothetical protein n=1 Tax=Luoshenia tenuis TaxID=2763654 RepID=UPI003D92A904
MRAGIWICVDAWEESRILGRFYHAATGKGAFKDLNQLLLRLEEKFDEVNAPRATTVSRSFGQRVKVQKDKGKGTVEKMKEKPEAGKKATFMVQVQYRENASWQGQITWVEANQTRNFRSALELIKLMDSAAGSDRLPEQREQARD